MNVLNEARRHGRRRPHRRGTSLKQITTGSLLYTSEPHARFCCERDECQLLQACYAWSIRTYVELSPPVGGDGDAWSAGAGLALLVASCDGINSLAWTETEAGAAAAARAGTTAGARLGDTPAGAGAGELEALADC
jgi:hypothetical protein